MKLNRDKINIQLAKRKWTITNLAKAYGVSRSRMNIILNSQLVTPVCAGRVAEALGCEVTEIID